MHPLLEKINLFDISSLTEENVKDILTEARVLPEKTSPPMCPICRNETSANRDSSRKLGEPNIKCFFRERKNSYTRCICIDSMFCHQTANKFSLGSIEYVPKKKRTTRNELGYDCRLLCSAERSNRNHIGSHHDKLLGGPGYGKEGLQLRKIEIPTAESEGISDTMPKTFNKKLLNALSDGDDEVPFVDDEDGDPNWEEF
ncbi:hypothetical protein TNCV_109892 [Trichonephila clavipes]|nr:hypothetical protein TNCV_109892 [Trichonephila clavipes]